MTKYVITAFVAILIIVSLWMFRFQYLDRIHDGRKYTIRKHVFTDRECYFLGSFRREELNKLGLVHCSVIDNQK